MSAITAWDDEDANIIVQGTHDAEQAMAAYQKYLTECGFKPGDEEYHEDADTLAFYEGMKKLWTGPPPADDSEEYYFDAFEESGDGRTPYLVGSL